MFTRRQVTLKGHFGSFDRNSGQPYENLIGSLDLLRRQTLEPNDILFLAETGDEKSEDVIALINDIDGKKNFGANWDTANLSLWGVDEDPIEYGKALAQAGILRGVHIKGGTPPKKKENWGSEISPQKKDITKWLEVLRSADCFDGAVIVEREMFLPAVSGSEPKRETQFEKARGLKETLKLIQTEMA